jgi:mannose-6-phosphate isomerase-like protein (cupin superfamily)
MRIHVLLLVGTLACGACASSPAPRWQRFVLQPEAVSQPLLRGRPMTRGMRSGRVVLPPGEHMHRHSTEANEEQLLFLQGRARVLLGAEWLDLAAGQALYIPPQTWHEVHNPGPEELRYVYTVAPAR